MKRILLFCLLVTVTLALPAQAPFFEWAAGVSGTSNNTGLSTLIDPAGNVYSSGKFRTTSDFAPGPSTYSLTSAGGQDAYVLKLDSSGNFLHAVRIGGTGEDGMHHLARDNAGNIYGVGFFNGT
ncbi:MAG: hypothetical protein RLZZ519_2942, partial [Bacteroidota bacterium]